MKSSDKIQKRFFLVFIIISIILALLSGCTASQPSAGDAADVPSDADTLPPEPDGDGEGEDALPDTSPVPLDSDNAEENADNADPFRVPEYSYDINRIAEGEGILYINEKLGFSLEFPKDWDGLYEIFDNDEIIADTGEVGTGIKICNKAARDAGYEGTLFYIDRFPGDWTERWQMPIYGCNTFCILVTSEYTYMLRMPASMEDCTISGVISWPHSNQYLKMLLQYEIIGESIEYIGEKTSYTIIPISSEPITLKSGLYVNKKLGFSLIIPAEWNELCAVINENIVLASFGGDEIGIGIEIYFIEGRNETSPISGTLFYIERFPGDWANRNSPINIGSTDILLVTDKYTYMLRTLSTATCDNHNEELYKRYLSMLLQYDDIGESISYIGDWLGK